MMKQYNIRSTCTRWFETTATHWISRRLSTCFSTIESGAREQSKVSETDGVPNLGGEHIGKDGEIIPKGMRYVSKEFYNTMRSGKIKIDDLLLVKDGATIGKIVCVKKMPYPDCSINEHVYILRTENNVCSQYIYYLFRSIPIQDQIWLNVRGSAQPGLTQQFLKSIAIYLPLIEEQNRIARYLDYKNHLINKYIRIKKKQIELLKELKQAIINDAVTGKIDVRTGKPYPKYKDSGIEWLGMIPEEWEPHTIGKLVSFNPSKNEINGVVSENLSCTFIPMERLSVDGVIDCSEKRPYHSVKGGFTYFKKFDLVIAKITPCFENAKSAWLSELDADFGFGTTEFIVMRVSQGVHGKFLSYIIASPRFLKAGKQFMRGAAGQQRVPVSFIKDYPIALPSTQTQSLILEYVTAISKNIINMIDSHLRDIDLSKELQTRLISDVVTGKLDVRSIEIPDFKEEPEELDEEIIDDSIEEAANAD